VLSLGHGWLLEQAARSLLSRLATSHAVDVSTGEVTASLSGNIRIDHLVIVRESTRLSCEHAEATVSLSDILGGALQAERVHLSQCRLQLPSLEPAAVRGDGESDPAEALRAIISRSDVIEITRLEVVRQAEEGRNEMIQFDWVRIEGSLDPPLVTARGSLDGRLQAGVVELISRLGDPMEIEVTTPEGLSTVWNGVELDVQRAVYRSGLGVVLEGLTARLPRVSAATDEEINPISDTDPFDFAEALAAGAWAQLGRLASLDWPDQPVTIEGARVEIGDGRVLSLQSLRWDPDGQLGGVVDISGAPVRFQFRPEAPEHIEIQFIAIDLEPVGDRLGEEWTLAGSANGSLSLDLRENSARVVGNFEIRVARLGHPDVVERPIQNLVIQAAVEAELGGDTGEGRSRVVLEVGVGGVLIDITLTSTASEQARTIELALGVAAEAECQAMFEAIPAALIPNLTHSGLRFEGLAAPRLTARYELGNPESFTLETDGFPGSCRVVDVTDRFDPAQLRSDEYVHTVELADPDETIRVGPGTAGYVPIDELPSYIPALMYLSEEINFYSNPGISIGLINRAVRMNLESGRYQYGGSTVSQQLVKNLFFSSVKTLSRKLEEALVVWAMESVVSKNRILEIYLNCLEFGPGIYGIQAAAAHYYGVPAAQMTPLQAAYLAALKPAPWRGAQHHGWGHSPNRGWWPRRVEELLGRLVEYGEHIDVDEVAHYAPYIVVFPTSAAFDNVEYEYIPRPTEEPLIEALP
jgi:hypothetical protein